MTYTFTYQRKAGDRPSVYRARGCASLGEALDLFGGAHPGHMAHVWIACHD